MSDKKIIEFIGRVERINYPKNRCFISNGEYGIVKMRCIENISNAETKKLYSLKGNCCEMEENGFEIKIKAEYESTHEIYGDSYKILFSQKIVDLSDKNKQKRFLKTIISENLVDNLYKGLKNPMQIIENNDIETLKSIKGIGELTAKRIIEKYNETKDNSEIYAELYNTGITPKMINKVIKQQTQHENKILLTRNFLCCHHSHNNCMLFGNFTYTFFFIIKIIIRSIGFK